MSDKGVDGAVREAYIVNLERERDRLEAERDRLREQGGLLTGQVMHMDNEILRLRDLVQRAVPLVPGDPTGWLADARQALEGSRDG